MLTPIKTDVLICGSGSAGLCAALWLARTGVDFRIIERRNGPLRIGQADGVSCRTMEILESFGIDQDLTSHAYWVNEVTFWATMPSGKLERIRRTADVLPGLSWQHHVIMNQAYLNELLIREMEKSCGRPVTYSTSLKAVEIDSSKANHPNGYPVQAVADDLQTGTEVRYEAKYLLGSDGAHSTVRKALGYRMIGDTTDAVWGVMDIFPRTNFPDIRKKTNIRSSNGSLMIIPREGDEMVRFYIQLQPGTWAKNVTLEDLHAAAKAIFSPFDIEFADTFWWSAYTIGQRLAECFSKDNRVFLAGDACHTHSPKAGQGMNLSLADGYNIGWKLMAVLKGHCSPGLLETYTSEREATAADLIAFDREITSLLKSASNESDVSSSQIYSDFFIKSAAYAAGLTTKYSNSMIISDHGSTPSPAAKVKIGMRFPSAQVVRLSDARAMQLSKVLRSDGKWRILVFAGDMSVEKSRTRLQVLGEKLLQPDSPIMTFTPRDADMNSLLEAVLVISGSRVAFEESDMTIPDVFTPIAGQHRIKDPHKVFIDDESYNYGYGRIYEQLGIDSSQGAVLITRPDQYVSMVTSMGDFDGINAFLRQVFRT